MPAADDLVLIASELAANAILHTQSRGSTFTVRCQLSAQAARVEVEDLGGPWRTRQPDDRPHGLDIIQALTGPDQWGTQPADTGGTRRLGTADMVTIGAGPADPRAWVRAAYKLIEAADAAAPGDELPAQHQITAELGISPATARRDCRELARLGLIHHIPGHGHGYPGSPA
jgi:hypothetical protein